MANLNPLCGSQANNVNLASFTYFLDYNDAVAGGAATSATYLLDTIPAGSTMLEIRVKVSTKFAGTAITALKLRLGDGTTTDKYLHDYDLVVDPADGTLTYSLAIEMGQLSAVSLIATLTSTGGNLSAMTAGQVGITVLMSRMLTPSSEVA